MKIKTNNQVLRMRDPMSLMSLKQVCSYIGNTSNMSMVEIGCYTGESTSIWCQNFKKVFAIDPWLSGKGYDANDVASQTMSDDVESSFDTKLRPYSNFTKMKMFSYDAISNFEERSLDFVYIDGEHTYKGVKLDISLYLPKIKNGGFIGGHDYKEKWKGVIAAVDESLGHPDFVFPDKSWIKVVNHD